MIILLVGLLLLFYGLSSGRKFSVGIGILFVLLIMGFQEGVPGDFQNYQYTYEHRGDELGVVSYLKESEYVYYFLVRFLSLFISFHGFVFITSLIQCLIIAKAIRTYACKRFHLLGLLLVFFTYNIMLLQMKAMRQGYAVDVMLLAYMLLDKKKYLWSLVAVGIAFGLHNSCVFSIPFYIFLFIIIIINRKRVRATAKERESKTNTTLAAVCMSISLLVFYYLKYSVFQSYITPILQGWEIISYDGYLEELDINTAIAWWILLYYIISTFFVSIYLFNEKDILKKYFAVLVLFSYFLYIGVFGYGNLQRIVMYFVIFTVVVLPNVAEYLRARYGRVLSMGYIFLNMFFLMLFSVVPMLSKDYSSGTGFGSYTFSFLSW